jgi:DNA primase
MAVQTSDDVKQAVQIEDIIHEDEPLTEHKRGRYRRGRNHDSLIVDVQRQCYWWNAHGEQGDVYTWLQLHRGLEFGEAVAYLATRCGLEVPTFSERDRQALETRRTKEAALGVIAQFLQQTLLASPPAKQYVHSRGWTIDDEVTAEQTANLARLGYWNGDAKGLRQYLVEHQIDPECPAAVALLGLRGDVAAWATRWSITPRTDWLHDGAIRGMPAGMLIYPFIEAGRVTYLAGRGLSKKRHYNLPAELVGDRPFYFNHVWTPHAKQVVIVEGQADALTLAQMGIAAIALAGTSIDGRLVKIVQRHEVVYVGLDHDKAGRANRAKVLDELGPLARLVEWPEKDANAWLQTGATEDDFERLLKAAPLWLDVVLEQTQAAEDEQRDTELRHVFTLLQDLDPFTLMRRRGEIARALNLSNDTFDALLKQMRHEVDLDDQDRPQYEVRANRTFLRVYDSAGHERLVCLAHFAAQIVAEVVEDDGESQVRKFEIEGRLPTGQSLPRIVVDAADFSQMQWVLEEWGSAAVIAAGATNRDHLRAALLIMSKQIETRHDYSHTGYRQINGRWRYLTAAGAVGLEGVQVRLLQNLARYQLPQVPLNVTEAMRASLRFWEVADYDISIPIWSAMFLAPLAQVLPLFFTIWLYGTTGSLKSTLTALALCHFGKFAFNTPPASWTATANALEKLAFTLKDCVLWIDDYTSQSTAAGNQELKHKSEHLLRDWGNGAGRARMRADLSLRQTFVPRGLIISTAEQLPPIESINSRLIQIESGPGHVTRGVGSALTLAQQDDASLYPHAMAGYVLYVAARMGEFEKSLPALQQELTEKARSEGGAHLRLPLNIATLFIGCRIGLEYAQHVGALNEEEALALLNVAWRVLIGLGERQQEAAVEEKPVDLYFNALEQIFAQGLAFLRHKDAAEDDSRAWPGVAIRTINSEFLGWYDDKYWYLLPTAAFNAVYRFYRTSGTVFPDTERGVRVKLLEQKRLFPNKDRFTYQLRLSGSSKVRVLRVGRPDIETDPSILEAGTAGTTVTTGTEEVEE